MQWNISYLYNFPNNLYNKFSKIKKSRLFTVVFHRSNRPYKVTMWYLLRWCNHCLEWKLFTLYPLNRSIIQNNSLGFDIYLYMVEIIAKDPRFVVAILKNIHHKNPILKTSWKRSLWLVLFSGGFLNHYTRCLEETVYRLIFLLQIQSQYTCATKHFLYRPA